MGVCNESVKTLLHQLEDILFDESRIYQKLLEQEQNKRTAIQNQDARELRKISVKQDYLLRERDIIEKERLQLFHELGVKFSEKPMKNLTTLLQVDLPDHFTVKFKKQAESLQSQIRELESLIITNQRMILHNIEFFKRILENAARRSVEKFTYNLKEEAEIEGGSSKMTRPVFLDTNC